MTKLRVLTALTGFALMLPAASFAENTHGAMIATGTLEGAFHVIDSAELPIDRIVNGTLDFHTPAVGSVRDSQGTLCSATLIGCRYVLTAANCFCTDPGSGIVMNGAQCAQDANALNPNRFKVFFPHAGEFGIEKITINPAFTFDEEQEKSDMALIKLKSVVTGIRPTPINRGNRPAPGTDGLIVGYGRTAGLPNQANVPGEDFLGLKRRGDVDIATCTEAPASHNLCWNFESPVDPPGLDTNSCDGDAGGPLLVDFGTGYVAAGVMASGVNPDCTPADQAWNTDVVVERNWIDQVGGSDITRNRCGLIVPAGADGSLIMGTHGELVNQNEFRAQFTMPDDIGLFRLALNGEEGTGSNPDFDLYLRAGTPPTVNAYDCASFSGGQVENCEVQSPAAGPWHVLVHRRQGSAYFQLTATIWAKAATTCTPGPNVLCLDNAPGDRRFKVTLDYASPARGISGPGKAIGLGALGVPRGGLMWFFNADNPEVLVKVLNGCGINNRFWVFLTAGTDVGYLATVTDTTTGIEKTYSNPDLTPAQPTQDVSAFSCASN